MFIPVEVFVPSWPVPLFRLALLSAHKGSGGKFSSQRWSRSCLNAPRSRTWLWLMHMAQHSWVVAGVTWKAAQPMVPLQQWAATVPDLTRTCLKRFLGWSPLTWGHGGANLAYLEAHVELWKAYVELNHESTNTIHHKWFTNIIDHQWCIHRSQQATVIMFNHHPIYNNYRAMGTRLQTSSSDNNNRSWWPYLSS